MRGPLRVSAGPLALALLLSGLATDPPRALAVPAMNAAPPQAAPTAPPRAAQKPSQTASAAPPEGSLGVQVFPGAHFLGSYDAGRGQRFYLYGTTASYDDVIAYYKVVLKQKGELVFDEPRIYVFEVGRFREDTMAFPSGVTVKDYSRDPSKGYLNPKPGDKPERFPTILQVVPLAPMPAGPPKH